MSHVVSLPKSRSGGGCHKINGYTFVNLTTHLIHITFFSWRLHSSISPCLTAGEFWAWQQTDCVKIASVSNCYQHLAQTFSISRHSGNSVFPTQTYLGLSARCFGWAACVMNCIPNCGQSLKQNSGGFAWIGLQFINCGEMFPGFWLVLCQVIWPLIGRCWHSILSQGLRPRSQPSVSTAYLGLLLGFTFHFCNNIIVGDVLSDGMPLVIILSNWDYAWKLRLCPTWEEKVFCPKLELCLNPINNEICVKLKSILDNKQQTSLVCQLIYYCIITKLIGTK